MAGIWRNLAAGILAGSTLVGCARDPVVKPFTAQYKGMLNGRPAAAAVWGKDYTDGRPTVIVDYIASAYPHTAAHPHDIKRDANRNGIPDATVFYSTCGPRGRVYRINLAYPQDPARVEDWKNQCSLPDIEKLSEESEQLVKLALEKGTQR